MSWQHVSLRWIVCGVAVGLAGIGYALLHAGLSTGRAAEMLGPTATSLPEEVCDGGVYLVRVEVKDAQGHAVEGACVEVTPIRTADLAAIDLVKEMQRASKARDTEQMRKGLAQLTSLSPYTREWRKFRTGTDGSCHVSLDNASTFYAWKAGLGSSGEVSSQRCTNTSQETESGGGGKEKSKLLVLHLQPQARIYGRVMDSRGRGVGAATVVVDVHSYRSGGSRARRPEPLATDVDGNYECWCDSPATGQIWAETGSSKSEVWSIECASGDDLPINLVLHASY